MKKIVRLTESDLARIVKRVINERQYLMEGVPNTTLKVDGPITVASRTVCGTIDYIKASIVVTNTGTEDAYINSYPYLKQMPGLDNMLTTTYDYNVTIGGKPVVGQADGQNQPKIPKGKKATVNFVIKTDLRIPEQRYKVALQRSSEERNPTKKEVLRKEAATERQNLYNAFKNLKSGTITLRYNGAPLEIPVQFGGFMIDTSRACDTQITLPKGF